MTSGSNPLDHRSGDDFVPGGAVPAHPSLGEASHLDRVANCAWCMALGTGGTLMNVAASHSSQNTRGVMTGTAPFPVRTRLLCLRPVRTSVAVLADPNDVDRARTLSPARWGVGGPGFGRPCPRLCRAPSREPASAGPYRGLRRRRVTRSSLTCLAGVWQPSAIADIEAEMESQWGRGPK
jgi:hypothetical protein